MGKKTSHRTSWSVGVTQYTESEPCAKPRNKTSVESALGPSPNNVDNGSSVASRPLDSNPAELLSRQQVEREYGIRVKTLERYAWAGGGPPLVKLGHRTVRYRRCDIEAFIIAHLVDG
jgi:predicted DNA-binding transcriptional regulator AlpA